MNISSALNTARSSMSAQTSRLSAIADKVANPGTAGDSATPDPMDQLLDVNETAAGFKASAAVFEAGADLWDVLASIKRD